MFRKLFLPLALFLFTVTACEFQEPVPSIPEPQAAEGGRCDEGSTRSFEMQYSGSGPGTFLVEIETGPFLVENCMCRLSTFQLYVSRTGSRWDLTVGSGQPVPFNWSALGQEDLLSVTDLETIYENIGNPGTGKLLVRNAIYNATLNHADGLCIVENYDGSGTVNGVEAVIGSWANGPIIEIKAGPVLDSYIVQVYLPLGITNAI